MLKKWINSYIFILFFVHYGIFSFLTMHALQRKGRRLRYLLFILFIRLRVYSFM